MCNKISVKEIALILFLFSATVLNAQNPAALGNVVGNALPYNPTALWDQMNNPGNNSVTSQNFESSLDTFDSFSAEQFGIMDDIWSVAGVEVRGAYYGGSGNAESVNVWFYNDSAGFPYQVIHSSLNIIPVNGLSSGSLSIQLIEPVNLVEGMYWVCVQANMPFISSGQWGWTTGISPSLNESVWKNPGGGFGSICTNWNYRASNCGIGTAPGLCFALLGNIIPVELTSFSAAIFENSIELYWQTATELNNSGFEIERKILKNDQDDNWVKIGFVEGNGTTTEPNNYTYTDKTVFDGKYIYRLKQIDYDGTFEYSKEVNVDFTRVTKFSLVQNYPNPFNPATRIQYSVSSRQFVTLKVYNLLGKEVATLVNENKEAGNYSINFDASNLPSGVYIYKLQAGEFTQSKKMTLVK